MTFESALRIFREQRFKDPHRAIEMIQRATSLDNLERIMVEERTYLSADQFVSFRIKSLYAGDGEFTQRTRDTARDRFRDSGLQVELIDYYVSRGGGVDIAIALQNLMFLGRMPNVPDNQNLLDFFRDANRYLFEALRAYVTEHERAER